MAAPLGNKNGANGTRWARAIERALAHKYKTVDGGLLEMAKVIVEAAAAGERDALKEIGERMDGKAPQALQLTGDKEAPVCINVTAQDDRL